MYLPKAFLAAMACLIAWWILSRILNYRSNIGRKLALPGMTVGCRKQDNGAIWVCDLCAFYGGTVDILLIGAALVLAAIGIWRSIAR